MATILLFNRSYISDFIDKEYNMSFCRLIDRRRLHELGWLCLSSSNVAKADLVLVLAAGFSNY
jgi:AraC-like DNA-binding protein